MSAVSLVKPTVGVVHVSMFGTAQGDTERAKDCARACFFATPGVRLAITAVGIEPAYETLAPGTRYTFTGYPA